MKKKALILFMFIFVAIICGGFSFSYQFNVYAYEVSNLKTSIVAEEDRFDTIFLKDDITKSELLDTITADRKKNKREQEVSVASATFENDTLTFDELVEICEANDYFVLETVVGFEIYYKFQLKTLFVEREIDVDCDNVTINNVAECKVLKYATEEETCEAYYQLQSEGVQVVADRIVTAAAIDNFTTGNFNSWGADAIDIDTYREYYAESGSKTEVVVAVLDTGINTSHELFQDRLLTKNGRVVGYCDSSLTTRYTYSGYSFEDDNTHGYDTNGNTVETYTGHGSHVSGTICELTPTNVKILPMKVLGWDGRGSYNGIIDALNAIVSDFSAYNVVSTNLSLGGKFSSTSDALYWNNKFSTAFNNLKEKNILSVVAAGNDKKDTSYVSPGGCEDSAIVVSALKKEGTNIVFDSGYSNYGNSVDISAPGTGIKSASIGKTNGRNTSEYKNLQGTSMATPHVAAAVALFCLDGKYYSGNTSTYTASEIENRLLDAALDLGTTGKDSYYGHGMLNLKYFNGNISYKVTDKTTTYNNQYHNITVLVSDVNVPTIRYGLTQADCTLTDISTNDAFKNCTNGAMKVYFKISAYGYVDTYGSGNLTINKAQVTIKTTDQTSEYGETVTLDQSKYTKTSGTVYGEDDLGIKLSTTATRTSPVAKYDINATTTNNNYSLTVQKGKLEITKRPIDVTILDQSCEYGEDITLKTDETAYEITSDKKLVNGDSLNLKLSTTATNASVVGESHKINFASANANYQVNPTSGNLTITPRSVKLQANKSAYYGDPINLDITYNIVSGSVINEDNLLLTFATTASSSSGVNWYPITATSGNANYIVEMVESYYKIYQRSIRIVPAEQSFVYGDTISLNQSAYTIENIVNGDVVEVSLTTTANSTTDVGNNYVIKSSYKSSAVTNNYSITCVNGTLIIAAKHITIKATYCESIYGDKVVLDNELWEVTTGSIINGDVITATLSTEATSVSPVGSYDINISASGRDVGNYDITCAVGQLVVTKRPINIKVTDQESVYGKDINLKTLYEVVSEKGVVNNDDLNIVLQTTATKTSPIGKYDITLSYDNNNYNVTYDKGTLSIKGREVSIVILPQTSVYGDLFVLDNSKYEIDDADKDLPIVLHMLATASSGVGEYDITASTSDENVMLSYEKGVYSITPRDLTVDIEDQTCTYGEININQTKYTLGATVNDETVYVELVSDATNASPVGGGYTISAQTHNKNYNLIIDKGNLTIIQKHLVITLTQQESYYGEILLDQTAYTLSRQPYNDDDLNIQLITDATNASNKGKYEINFTFDNSNYNITGEKGVFVVNPRNIIISLHQQSVYGEKISLDPYDFEVVSHNQIVNSDNLNLYLSTEATERSVLGFYDIKVVAQNTNYTVNVERAKVEITKRPITIISQDQTSVYGNNIVLDQTKFDFSENAIVNGDIINVSLSTRADSTSVVDDYLINISWTGEKALNYDISTESGMLKIQKRKITIDIADQSSMYGNDIALENLYEVVSQNQIVNGDNLNIEMKTTAKNNSPVGTYTIYLTYNNPNYDVAYIEGTLTIEEGDLILTILPQSFVYGDEIVLDQSKVTLSQDVDLLELGVVLNTDARQFDNVGTGYSITATISNENYKVVINKGQLEISPRPISITLENQNKVYGELVLDQDKFTINDEVLNGDNLGLRLYTHATQTSNVKQKFDILFTHTNSNYSITSTNTAQLEINKRELVIKTVQTGIYGNVISLNNADYSKVSGSVVNNDDLEIVFATNASKFSPVGHYEISIASSNFNYDVSLSEDSEFNIEERSIKITTEQSKYYGDDVVLNNQKYTIISGSVVNDDSLNLVFSTVATKESFVGSYDVLLDEFNSNYDVELTSGKMHVLKRILFIETVQSGAYGNYFALNNLYNIVEGSLAFESDQLNVRFETNASVASSVGNYDIFMSFDNSNYDVELKTTSHFKVLPRELKVSIADQASIYGEDVILNQNAYEIVEGSVVNQDVVSIVLSTMANKNSDVGEYEIVGYFNNLNYNIIFNKGTYTIEKRQIVIKLDNQKSSRGITFEVDQKAYSIIDGEMLEGDDLGLELYTNAERFSMMGNYDIKAHYNNSNYDVKIIEGNLFVSISFIDVSVVLLFGGITAFIVVKVVKRKKAKAENQKLFDKWIKW